MKIKDFSFDNLKDKKPLFRSFMTANIVEESSWELHDDSFLDRAQIISRTIKVEAYDNFLGFGTIKMNQILTNSNSSLRHDIFGDGISHNEAGALSEFLGWKVRHYYKEYRRYPEYEMPTWSVRHDSPIFEPKYAVKITTVFSIKEMRRIYEKHSW